MDAKRNKSWGGGWLAFALLFGMLIWVRLRLVTDIPRAAYAEPVEQQARQTPTPATPADQKPEPAAVASVDAQAR